MREFHTECAFICESLEALFRVNDIDGEQLQTVAYPVILRFRDLLDVADRIAGPDS